MLSRRSFLLSTPAAAASASQAQSTLKIRSVDIVHHTHTDIGYTELPSVIRDLQVRYLNAALDACAADPAFRWTVESLVELDDWWRVAPQRRRDELLGRVRSGQMDVMAMPFNQTPFLNAAQWQQMMRWIPADLWRQLNIRAAMQNDVNGMPRAGAMLLLDRGVRHLLMGLNADSGGPPFRRPSAFWWKMPDGRKVFVWHGEHYGRIMDYLKTGRKGKRMLTDEASLRAAQQELSGHLRRYEGEGFEFDRLIMTFTDPFAYDNGGPFPTLAPFVAAWNRLGLAPSLRLVTATQAVLEMEQAVGSRAPTFEGEWTDWWANGDASGPREVAASRMAKRYYAAAMSPMFGPPPERAKPDAEAILRDLCLFDEHTWGASQSIAEPYSPWTLAQYVEKSALAYRPMGHAEILLRRRVRAKTDSLPAGVHVLNPSPREFSGWASVALDGDAKSLRDTATGERVALERQGRVFRFWIERLAGRSLRSLVPDSTVTPVQPAPAPDVRTDGANWPVSVLYAGMTKPLFAGSAGNFLCVGAKDRRTVADLHKKPDEQIRNAAIRESAATYETATSEDTPHTIRYTQRFRHERLASGSRTLELWKRDARAHIAVRFDRISMNSPEVFFLDFALPEGLPLPRFSCGGVPFTPYTDQLKGSCRDYFGIDGWAHYATANGHWLWVTRDAPLVAVGAPHVVERHQAQPANPNRILAMVFDNCWHTNFVADSNGQMEFHFDLVWQPEITRPDELAETLAGNAIVVVNPDALEPESVIQNDFRP